MLQNRAWLFYLIAFLEGGAVMASELTGAKMMAPFYGNSLYVWTNILATTLCGLTAGYYLGGIITRKFNVHKSLFTILLISVALLFTMPPLSSVVMQAMLGASVAVGSLISAMVFIFPVLLCFGMISPIIISIVTAQVKEVGRQAGTVYAISTAGGIIMTFFMGFYFIPFMGLKASVYFTAMLVAIATIIALVAQRTNHVKAHA